MWTDAQNDGEGKQVYVYDLSGAETSAAVKPVIIPELVDLDALAIAGVGYGQRHGMESGWQRRVEVARSLGTPHETVSERQRRPQDKKRECKARRMNGSDKWSDGQMRGDRKTRGGGRKGVEELRWKKG